MRKTGCTAILFLCCYYFTHALYAEAFELPSLYLLDFSIKTSPAEPYVNGLIEIQPGTRELLLLFKKNAPIDDVYLTTPGGVKRALHEEDNGIFATAHYEIIKITYPFVGTWILSGPEEQKKQVLVLTDVKIGTNFSPGTYFNKELLALEAYLEQSFMPVSSDMPVENMQVTFALNNKNHHFSYVIPYSKDGVFDNNLILNVPEGTYTAQWKMDSHQLAKERDFTVHIKEYPFKQFHNKEHDAFLLELTKPELIKPDSLHIQVFYKDEVQDLDITRSGLSWIINFFPLCQHASFSEDNLLLQITAQTTDNRRVLFKSLIDKSLCSANAIPWVKPKEQVPYTQTVEVKKEIPQGTPWKKIILIASILLLLLFIALAIFFGMSYRSKLTEENGEAEAIDKHRK